MKIPFLKKAIFIFTLGTFLWGCRVNSGEEFDPLLTAASALDASTATNWADLQLKLIRTTPGWTPPVASRGLGYVGVTLYEAVVPGMPGSQSLVGQLNGLTILPKPEASGQYNWAVSANAAEALITKNLWANTSTANKATIDSLETAVLNSIKTTDVNISETTIERSVAFGKAIATAIFEWSKTDKGHEGYTRNQPTSYVPPTGAGRWVQTTTGDAGRAMQPFWGQNRTFLVSNANVAVPAPIAFSTSTTSPFFAQALEVYSTGKNLTTEQRTIATFWADGSGTITPAGHSFNITTIALKKANAKLDKAAEAYARAGIAIADAFICCWKSKYTYNMLRPFSYIRSTIDATWTPAIGTPPFPEYVSGHSTHSGAVSQVLSDVFGYQFAFTDNTHTNRGFTARTYRNFYEAADEASISRLYGGIHFRQGNEAGMNAGKAIGRNVSAIRFKRVQ